MQSQSTPFRKDRTSDSGTILFYIRGDIPCKIIKTETDAYNEGFSIDFIGKTLEKLSASDNIIFLADFNVEPGEAKMSF